MPPPASSWCLCHQSASPMQSSYVNESIAAATNDEYGKTTTNQREKKEESSRSTSCMNIIDWLIALCVVLCFNFSYHLQLQILVVLSLSAAQSQNALLKNEKAETTTYIPILKYNKEQGIDGSYKSQYETGNHIAAHETGYLKDANEANPNGVLVQEGTFTYETPEGEVRPL